MIHLMAVIVLMLIAFGLSLWVPKVPEHAKPDPHRKAVEIPDKNRDTGGW